MRAGRGVLLDFTRSGFGLSELELFAATVLLILPALPGVLMYGTCAEEPLALPWLPCTAE